MLLDIRDACLSEKPASNDIATMLTPVESTNLASHEHLKDLRDPNFVDNMGPNIAKL